MSVRPSPFDQATAVHDHLERECAEFLAAAEEACDVHALGEQCSTRSSPGRSNEAFASMLVQVLNDWNDLVQSCGFGAGRPAFRSARSIFEISLFGLDLFDDANQADRYLDHDIILQLQLAEQQTLDHLQGKQLKAARHSHEKKLKLLGRRVDELVKRYGPGYRRSWTNDNVRERAEHAGRLGEYAFYRYASGVVHGSVSGRDGSLLRYESPEPVDHPEGMPVYRLGLNLYLCVQALQYGLGSFRHFFAALEQRGISAATAVLHNLEALGSQLGAYESAMLALHQAISPTETPSTMNTVALVQPTGVHELYLHDVANQRVIAATADNPQRVATKIARARHELPNSDIAQTIELLGEAASAKRGSSWESDERLVTEHRPFVLRPGARVITPDGAFGVDDDLQPFRFDSE